MIPKTGLTEEEFNRVLEEEKERVYNNFTYKIENNRLVGTIDNIESYMQAINLITNVERFKYISMSDNIGVELEDYYGLSGDLLELHLASTIVDAIKADDRTKSIDSVKLTKVSRNTYDLEIYIDTIFGDITFKKEVVIGGE